MNSNKGLTLIELLLVIAIMSVLSGVILISVLSYVDRGKDSSIAGNLVVLIPSGEVFYNSTEFGMGNKSYFNFCNTSVVRNAIVQMPKRTSGASCADNSAGLCCNVNEAGDKWAACAKEFVNSDYAYCVDSRGVAKEINKDDCTSDIEQCPDYFW
jgi:prepilin-type N-terminal cleavage/methylation domain-containing protein